MTEVSSTTLVPRVSSQELRIPVTIDYNAGRSQSNKSRLIWAGVATAGVVLFDVLTLFFSSLDLVTRIGLPLLITVVGFFAIRYLLLREHRYRRELRARLEDDYQITMSNFWGIYKIDGERCYYRNGWVGMFVMFEKGPVVGKTDEDEYNHYEAIADALNIINSSGMRVAHIDMMDFIGNDNRIRKAIRKVNTYSNESLRNLVDSMFRHLQIIAENSVTSYDVYLFLYKGDDIEFRRDLASIIACFLEANYSSYTILDRANIQRIASSLFNMDTFSITNATREAFRAPKDSVSSIRPISIKTIEGTEILNLTTSELKEESRRKAEQKALVQEELKRRKSQRKSGASVVGRRSAGVETVDNPAEEELIDFNASTEEDVDIFSVDSGATSVNHTSHKPARALDDDDMFDFNAEG